MRFAISDSILANWNDDGQSVVTGDIDDFVLRDDHSHVGIAPIAAVKAEITPNPADNMISISLPGNTADGTITLLDMTGRNVKTITLAVGNSNYTMNTQDIPAGVYNVIVRTDMNVQSSKIAVVH